MKNKIYIITAIFGLIALILVVLAIYPLFRGIKKDSEALMLFKKELILLEKKIKNIEEFGAVSEGLKPDLEKADKMLIDPEVPVDFIKFLEENAEDSGLLIDISPAKDTERGILPWPSLEFQIVLSGPFSDFLEFLEKTEASPYLIEIKNINIKGITKEKSKEEVNANLVIKVFTK